MLTIRRQLQLQKSKQKVMLEKVNIQLMHLSELKIQQLEKITQSKTHSLLISEMLITKQPILINKTQNIQQRTILLLHIQLIRELLVGLQHQEKSKFLFQMLQIQAMLQQTYLVSKNSLKRRLKKSKTFMTTQEQLMNKQLKLHFKNLQLLQIQQMLHQQVPLMVLMLPLTNGKKFMDQLQVFLI